MSDREARDVAFDEPFSEDFDETAADERRHEQEREEADQIARLFPGMELRGLRDALKFYGPSRFGSHGLFLMLQCKLDRAIKSQRT
jgi:hypothetical protein